MPKIAWVSSYEAAAKSARASKKLLMIDFYTDWCHYCKKLDAEVYPHPKVVQFCGQLVSVKLNAEREGMALAKKYGVTGFPTVLYLDAEGNEWGRMPGFLPAEGFLQFGNGILKSFKEQPVLEAKLRQNPSNAVLAADLTERFARQGNETKALWAAGLAAKGPQTGKCAAAYGALGGYYVKAEKAAKARPWLNKSIAIATDPRDKAYGHFGLAFCFIGERNAKGARAELNAVLKVAGCPQGLQDNARKLLEQIPK